MQIKRMEEAKIFAELCLKGTFTVMICIIDYQGGA